MGVTEAMIVLTKPNTPCVDPPSTCWRPAAEVAVDVTRLTLERSIPVAAAKNVERQQRRVLRMAADVRPRNPSARDRARRLDRDGQRRRERRVDGDSRIRLAARK